MKKIEFKNMAPQADLYVVPLYAKKAFPKTVQAIDEALQGGVSFNCNREKFEGEFKQLLKMTTNGTHPYAEILLLGLGMPEACTPILLKKAGGLLAKQFATRERKTIVIDCTDMGIDETAKLIFGIQLKDWKFDKYQQCKKKTAETELIVYTQFPDKCEQAYVYYKCLFSGVSLARELTSEPANVLYPEAYATRCLKLADVGIKVEVLDEKQLTELGANAILAVGQGSSKPSRMVILRWDGGSKDQKPIALVGKGVCYDSGGINIKTSALLEMKWDKAGAGAVVGTLYTLALLKAPINVVGAIGLVENMPDGAAFKPGDIIKSLSGKTIEIIDTDNEGRLVLADCLWYLQNKYHPEYIIDFSTLTLETMGALGSEYAGLFCEDESLSAALISAGHATGEKLWPLPMGEYYAKQIQSTFADIKNMGILGFGESSSTAEFLKCFIQPDKRWAHIDIAGVAWSQEDLALASHGVTGFGVRLLVEWLLKK